MDVRENRSALERCSDEGIKGTSVLFELSHDSIKLIGAFLCDGGMQLEVSVGGGAGMQLEV